MANGSSGERPISAVMSTRPREKAGSDATLCLRLLALRQPAGRDLRFITTALKITTDLERIGDRAVSISERAIELGGEPPLKPYIDIPRMADISLGMLRSSLDAFGSARIPSSRCRSVAATTRSTG